MKASRGGLVSLLPGSGGTVASAPPSAAPLSHCDLSYHLLPSGTHRQKGHSHSPPSSSQHLQTGMFTQITADVLWDCVPIETPQPSLISFLSGRNASNLAQENKHLSLATSYLGEDWKTPAALHVKTLGSLVP